MRRVRILIDGRVQGVGFRYHTCTQAQKLGVNGWVRNLSDGRVEAEFEGSEHAVNDMLAWCRQGPVTARVQVFSVVSSEEVPAPSYSAFTMRG